jgi:hypothetical protein
MALPEWQRCAKAGLARSRWLVRGRRVRKTATLQSLPGIFKRCQDTNGPANRVCQLPGSVRRRLALACLGGQAGIPCNIPRALMSSSMSGQRTPSPLPIITKRLRCAGVALDSRHDHASGTLTVRPSANWATRASSVTSSATMRGSLLAAVFIPYLPNMSPSVENDLANTVQFLG